MFRGAHIYDDNFQSIRIRIAFRSRDGRFEVANSATDKDPEFIPDISVQGSTKRMGSGVLEYRLVKRLKVRLQRLVPMLRFVTRQA